MYAIESSDEWFGSIGISVSFGRKYNYYDNHNNNVEIYT